MEPSVTSQALQFLGCVLVISGGFAIALSTYSEYYCPPDDELAILRRRFIGGAILMALGVGLAFLGNYF